MDMSIVMRIICNVKHRYVIRLKFGDKFLTFLTSLELKGKASIVVSFRHLLSLS